MTHCFANCKVNLGLNIVSKREDGFHNIETVFYPVSLYDIIEIEEVKQGETVFTSSGLEIPGDPTSNLIMKALELISKDFDLPKLKIHLHKVIPMGAGLGGGSSDAAAFLSLLNREYKLGLTQDQLMDYCRCLGSDCAFFIKNQPVFATQKGDRFEDYDLDLTAYKIVIVKPEIHVSTQEAYASVQVCAPSFSIKELLKSSPENWKGRLVNDFEDSVFSLYPEIGEIKDRLYAHGALYASMSGSGSAVFGIFKSVPDELSGMFEGMFYCQMSLI